MVAKIFLIGLFLIALMGLIRLWVAQRPHPKGGVFVLRSLGYRPIFAPPNPHAEQRRMSRVHRTSGEPGSLWNGIVSERPSYKDPCITAAIDFRRLVVQWMSTAVLVGAVALAIYSRSRPR